MCQALMEIMEPEIRIREQEKEKAALQQGMRQGMQRGIRQGIQGAVEMLRKFGRKEAEIKAAIMEEYGLSAEEAEGYFQ